VNHAQKLARIMYVLEEATNDYIVKALANCRVMMAVEIA